MGQGNIIDMTNMSIEDRREYILNSIGKSEFIKHLDIDFLTLTLEEAVGRIELDNKYLNPYGSMHGGCLYSLADTVAGCLACMCGRMCTTVDGSLNFLSPAIGTKYVYCNAKLVRSGKHLCNVNVTITGDDGQLFDNGSFNYFKMA